MKKIVYIGLLLLAGLSCKKEQDKQTLPTLKAEGTLYDTLTQRVIPNCRVFLMEQINGREQVATETSTDSKGRFTFDSLTQGNSIQFANNSYAWHHPQGLAQEKYWLKPYVTVELKIHPMPGYHTKAVRGGFNEEYIDFPQTLQPFVVTASIYDSLHIELIRQKHLDTNAIDTLHFYNYISATNQIIQLYE